MEKLYFTLTGTNHHYGTDFMEPGMEVNLVKDPENNYDKEAIKVEMAGLGLVGFVANSPHTVNGRAHADSDLDILLEYKGSAREDAVFNVLHDTPIYIQGIIVDINPIKAECSGIIDEYLQRCDDSWKEHKVRRGKGR